MEIISGIKEFIANKKEQLYMSNKLNYFQSIAISWIINFLNELSRITGNNIDTNTIEKKIKSYKLQIFNKKNYLGLCCYDEKVIYLDSEILKNDKEQAINTLIHENSHVLSFLLCQDFYNVPASIEEGMAEIFTNLVLNFHYKRYTYYEESYFYNKEALSFLLANTSCPFDLIYFYYFISKGAFNNKLLNELNAYNPSLIRVLSFFEPYPHVYDLNYGIEKIIKPTISNMPIEDLYYKCSNDIFYFDNYYIISYLANKNLNFDLNVSNIELLLIEMSKRGLSAKFLFKSDLLREIYYKDPANFYRIRPYASEKLIKNFKIEDSDLQFSNIVNYLKQGNFIPDILNYTGCYNCYATDYSKFLFLNALIRSDGIRNGFLCNECLEVAKALKGKMEFNITIMLIEESVNQFFKWNINNIGASYDHYTHMILAKAKTLLEELQNYDQCYTMVCYYLNKINMEINYVSQFAPDFFSNIHALNNYDVLRLSMDKNISILTKYFKELYIQKSNSQAPRFIKSYIKSIHRM